MKKITNVEIDEIFNRRLSGQAQKFDHNLLESWYNDQHAYSGDAYPISERIEDAMIVWKMLDPQPVAKRKRLWPRFAIAASLLIATFYGGYLVIRQPKSVDDITFANSIKPGGNHAYLTLGNGKRILLDDVRNGKVADQPGIKITKVADGTILYTMDETESDAASNPVYNMISTPMGGKYQIQLPDGTIVWLNAASSIKFPASFASHKTRSVVLNGEAYFEVAKDKIHPFEVKARGQNIEVLGTHFNVNAYSDERISKTTLLEGSVKVWPEGSTSNFAKTINPGEQASTGAGGIEIHAVDVDNVIDWKNDEFYFKDMDFKTAMRKIARWYDLEVVYETGVDTSFEPGGWISRKSSISSVLKMMESTGLVHFKAEGRRITVTK